MSEEEKSAIEQINYIEDFIIENGSYYADVGDIYYFSILLNLIQNQDTEINKLNNVIDRMAEKYATCKTCLKYDCKKRDKNAKDCIKEYFMKEDK